MKFIGYLFTKLIDKFGGDNQDLITIIIIVVLIVIGVIYNACKKQKS